MNYLAIDKCSTCNGKGFRVVLWVAGCEHHCKGCHNPSTWDKDAGKEFTISTMETLLGLLNKPYIKGLTISGGDPLIPCNREQVAKIVASVKDFLPEKDIWVYTGYKYEELNDRLLEKVDFLVDGEFKLELRDVTLPFRGSSNQRIIDMQETRKAGKVVEYVI